MEDEEDSKCSAKQKNHRVQRLTKRPNKPKKNFKAVKKKEGFDLKSWRTEAAASAGDDDEPTAVRFEPPRLLAMQFVARLASKRGDRVFNDWFDC